MRAVIQRVKHATLTVGGEKISEIGKGLVVYLGVGKGDTENAVDTITKKIANMRIFEDENGKMNYSALSIGAEILCVSQFTLYADCAHGNRPSFTYAEAPEIAARLYDDVCNGFTALGIRTKKGIFGADMKIDQLNDGPVTIIYEV